MVIIFTMLLIFFGAFSLQTSEKSTNFVSTKPDILIVNQDKEEGITQNLIQYMKENCNEKEIENTEEARQDALFYRDVNYIIYIPAGYAEDFKAGKNPVIETKSTGDYQASYAEMLLNRYLKIATIYQTTETEEADLIEKINQTLEKETQVEVESKLDTDSLAKATFYFNFSNYSILAGCVYVIALVLSTFRENKIKKRTIISSMDYKKYNRILLVSNGIFAIVLWALYVIIGAILVPQAMFTTSGIFYLVNSFVFTICALTLAILIANLVSSKNAINGIVNVVALGSSFLCGAFVSAEWLPDIVLKIAHFLPSYWFIQNNDLLKTMENFNQQTLQPFFINLGVVVLFSIGFIIINNMVSKKKQKIG